jgi:sugar lactone lactonase YvrE
MHTMGRNSRARRGSSGWLTTAVTVAAIASGGIALASPANAAPAQTTAQAAAPAPDPVNCPSAGCRRVAENLTDPYSVATDGRGKAYVANGSTGNLVEVDLASGAQHEVTTGLGKTYGVALDGNGHAFVTSTDSGKLYEVDLSNGRKTEVAGGLGSPHSLALDGHGKAIVTDYTNDKVWEVDLSNGRKAEITTGIDNPHGIALDGNGTAYVAAYDAQKLYAIDLASGRKSVVADDVGKANGIALHDGHAYMGTNDGKLLDVDLANGDKRTVATSKQMHGVAVDKDGSVYVADNTNDVLWRVNDGGNPTPPPPPPSGDAKVDLKPVPDITAKPGGSAVPRINVKNTGGKRIGNQDITLKLGPEGVSWGFNVVYQDRDGNLVETPCHVVDGDPGTSLCKDVPLNLDPGQSVELRTEVGTSSSLKPGDMPSITWKIADKTAKTDWLMK